MGFVTVGFTKHHVYFFVHQLKAGVLDSVVVYRVDSPSSWSLLQHTNLPLLPPAVVPTAQKVSFRHRRSSFGTMRISTALISNMPRHPQLFHRPMITRSG